MMAAASAWSENCDITMPGQRWQRHGFLCDFRGTRIKDGIKSGLSMPSKLLLLVKLLVCLPVYAGIDLTWDRQDHPVIASSFYSSILMVTTSIGTSDPREGTELSGDVSKEISSYDRKLKLAHDDAAVFIASNGAVRGAMLQAVLDTLRQRVELARYSDLQLALAVLAYPPR